MSDQQLAIVRDKPMPGTSVTADMARAFIQAKTRVCTSEVYRSRLPAGTVDASEGGMGLIMGIHGHEAGHICDVLWDTGKAYGGYCVGYHGCYDLLVADPGSVITKPQAPKTKTSKLHGGVESDGAQVEVAVGYLASAPRVTHVGGKHIWSSDGPLFSKE